ncbi:uncharacterized protein MYCGRDRAFT_98669 [Zymoseptoria tritici IPO323]|uniref:Uncharacterized protein n=1 Tax=Zymoseptoria tritici (strain CBS 115943 / IPO323) TaxID=336722 RepID=F9WWR7_ZYMTI|nr:uncharacterized protein MYCGRDRAFT_98669 [Zymoseptoria tritici IPO323]EGP92148.1 hypothetical protein MYCGRDRAFT_98669 [Zymoseptoria tritici IPO323]
MADPAPPTSSDPHNLRALEKDPRLFLYTSLTAGSSHIITATSRMETILKANRIPFQAIDLATDEQARRLWQRRGGAKKKLPGLVKEGYIIGDIDEVEEWNEFGELKENIGPVPAHNAPAPAGGPVGVNTAPPLSHNAGPRIALPGAAEIAAIQKAKKEKAAEEREKAKAEDTKVEDAKLDESKTDDLHVEDAEVTITSPTSRTIKFKGDESPSTAEEEEKKRKRQHRGSQIIEATPEEIMQVESQNSLAEVEGEDDEVVKEDGQDQEERPTTKGVEGLKIVDDEPSAQKTAVHEDGVVEKTQDQSAKDPEAVGKSVED